MKPTEKVKAIAKAVTCLALPISLSGPWIILYGFTPLAFGLAVWGFFGFLGLLYYALTDDDLQNVRR